MMDDSAVKIDYFPDSVVDGALDEELRRVLSICFTKPQDVVFLSRRYFNEMPRHRWVIRDGEGNIVAHAALHEKTVESGGQTFRIGGVAEVCVLPAWRGRGYVRALLAAVREWLSSRGFAFAVLFGNEKVYGSSGYTRVENLFHDSKDEKGAPCRKQATALVRPLSGTPWPTCEVYLPGNRF